jgi:hypothetical protein
MQSTSTRERLRPSARDRSARGRITDSFLALWLRKKSKLEASLTLRFSFGV